MKESKLMLSVLVGGLLISIAIVIAGNSIGDRLSAARSAISFPGSLQVQTFSGDNANSPYLHTWELSDYLHVDTGLDWVAYLQSGGLPGTWMKINDDFCISKAKLDAYLEGLTAEGKTLEGLPRLTKEEF
ncbi:MAG: hypothetical protein LBJ11_06075 [Oscillospiraceae bacterium]|nr:hypothetical protein [Oscillospiraceae bacterium]